MTARITVHAMERSLPTSVPYRSDRITSFSVELDDHGVAPDQGLLDAIRREQLVDLDNQEAKLRARYAMHQPRPPEGQAEPAKVPADAKRDVTDDTRHELRRLAMRAHELGIATDMAPPASEAAAQDLARQLRASIYDAERKAQPSAPAAPPAPKPAADFYGPPSAPKPAAPSYPPGATVPAGRRICADAAHGREPRPITSEEWDFSVKRYARPLCRLHQRSG